MNKILFTFKWIGVVVCLILMFVNVQAKVHHVYSNSKSLKKAYNRSNAHDTLLIHKSWYKVSDFIIDKPITILGKNNPVFDGQKIGQVIIVKSDSVHIKGISVRNSKNSFVDDNAGIKLDEVKDCSIINCNLKNNFFSIYLAKSQNCLIKNNTIKGILASSEATAGNGIHLWYCKNIDIIGNKVSNQRDGLYFEFVEHGLVEGNKSYNNMRYGLHFMFSHYCKYRNNEFINNGGGVAVMYTKNVEMFDNVFKKNWGSASYGLLLKDITDSEIRGNKFIMNSTALYSENSSRLLIEKNDFIENGWAIKIKSNSMDNVFIQNNFINNSFDVSTNSRSNYSSFDKNYWSSYSGYDLNKDGYGDVPYHPVRLFSVIVAQNPTSLMLHRSIFIDIIDFAESIFPVLTPETLIDTKPLMKKVK